MTRTRMSMLAVMLVSLSAPAASEAFHEVSSFARTANTGGGAGTYFTGSRASKGYDCSICHLEAEQRISVQVESPLNSGSYRPGLIYPITVKLVGEHRGLESAFNPNTFTADMVDASGAAIGQFAGGDVKLVRDRTIAIAEGFGNGEVEWNFSWWAPDEPLAATLHIAMLDGDGASDPERRFIDPYHDDVATLQLALCPEGSTCPAAGEPDADVSPTGCSAGSGIASWWTAPLLLLLMAMRRTGPRSGSHAWAVASPLLCVFMSLRGRSLLLPAAIVALLGACANSWTVTSLSPDPDVLVELPPGRYVLELDKRIADSFDIPNNGSVVAVHVSGWRQSLQAGFGASLGKARDTSAQSDDLWTIRVITAKLAFVRKDQSASTAMLASLGSTNLVAHGQAPSVKTPKVPKPVFARIDVQASLQHSTERAPRAVSLTVYSHHSVGGSQSASHATQSAIAQMYEAMASEVSVVFAAEAR